MYLASLLPRPLLRWLSAFSNKRFFGLMTLLKPVSFGCLLREEGDTTNWSRYNELKVPEKSSTCKIDFDHLQKGMKYPVNWLLPSLCLGIAARTLSIASTNKHVSFCPRVLASPYGSASGWWINATSISIWLKCCMTKCILLLKMRQHDGGEVLKKFQLPLFRYSYF